MLKQIVAANIDHYCKPRANLCDVREALIRPDTYIHSAAYAGLTELADDMQIGSLVRDQVVGIKIATGLGQARRQRGKRLVIARRVSYTACPRAHQKDEYEARSKKASRQ